MVQAARRVEPGRTASSRVSADGAGWGPVEVGSYRSLLPERRARLSWFNPRTLWLCRNDPLSLLADPVPERRAAWLAGVPPEALTVDLSDRYGAFSFLLVGDPGEGDESQYAVVPPLLAEAEGTAFLLLCSDVLYPVGDVNDYADKFYRPYQAYPGPVYALPGNHDWYDDLHAFMHHFCGRSGLDVPRPRGSGPGAWLQDRLWRSPPVPDEQGVGSMRALRSRPEQAQPVPQPGPYFVLDTQHVRLVCLDTGILGDVDAEQGRWLVDVSADPRPKLLLTGRPLLVDGTVRPCRVAGAPHGFADVLDVVHHDAFRYVAVIAGDTHNYQRYPVRVHGRTVHHVVSGGGGAFMHATHLVPPVDPRDALGVTEEEFRCYPLRRDSLAAYSIVLQTMLDRLHLPLRVRMTPDEAGEVLARRGLRSARVRSDGTTPSPGGRVSRRLAGLLLMAVGGRRFHTWFSPFYDWDCPPFFKQFLRVDVTAAGATVTCFGVSGARDAEAAPPVEDRFEVRW